MIYFLILFFLFFLSFQFDVRKKKTGFRFFWYLSFVIIVLVAGLRYKVGGDTFVYMNGYKDYPTFSQFSSFDFKSAPYQFGWYLFCAICKFFSKSYFFMQFIHALIINLIFFNFIYKYVHFRFLGLIIYFGFGFLYFDTEIMRESISVGIFLIALDSFYRKNWVRYYLLIGLAICFHISALFLLIFPFFSSIKLNKTFFISLLIALVMAGAIWREFNEYINYLNAISSIEKKANTYLNSDYTSNLNGVIRSIFTYFFVPFLFAIFAFRNSDRVFREIPLVWIYILFGIFSIFNVVVFVRFQNYLFFPFLAFIANLCFNVSERNKLKPILLKNLRIMMLFLMLFFGRYYHFFTIDLYGNSYFYQRYFPYYSIITEQKSPARASFEYAGW